MMTLEIKNDDLAISAASIPFEKKCAVERVPTFEAKDSIYR